MTDNNADDADGQNSKLSRRGAVALLGTAAVGGTAATGAFSKLTADRPIEVEVVSNGDSELGAENTTSTLKVTNNVNEDINATITADDFSNVSVVELNGSNTASLSESDQSAELTGLNSSGTAEIDLVHRNVNQSVTNGTDSTNVVTDETVTFDVEAFSGTNGYSIGSDQAVLLNKAIPSTVLHRYTFDSDGETGSVADTVGSNHGTINGPSFTTSSVQQGSSALEFNSANNEIVDGFDNLTSSYYDEGTFVAWIKPDSDGYIFWSGVNNNGEARALELTNGNLLAVAWANDFSTSSSIPNNEWTHCVFSWDQSADYGALYIDGSLSEDTDGLSITYNSPSSQSVALGYKVPNNSAYYDGEIDDVLLFDSQLSETEVARLYNSY